MALSRTQRIVLGIGLSVLLVTVAAAGWLLRTRNPQTAGAATDGNGPGPAGAAAGDGNGAASGAPAAPAATAYDPTKLLEAGLSAGEVWDKEPRVDAWADGVEAAVGGAMAKDLSTMVPGAAVILKCKALSCLVGIDAPEDKRAAAMAVTRFVMLAPWVVDLSAEEDGTLRWLFFEEPRFADVNTFVPWYQQARKRTLERIRSRELANPFPVPLAEAPTE